MRTVLQIHACEPPGDVLLFLTGEEEIEGACRKIREEGGALTEEVRPTNRPTARPSARPSARLSLQSVGGPALWCSPA